MSTEYSSFTRHKQVRVNTVLVSFCFYFNETYVSDCISLRCVCVSVSLPPPISYIPYSISYIPYPISYIPYPISYILYPISCSHFSIPAPLDILHLLPHSQHPISYIIYPISYITYHIYHAPISFIAPPPPTGSPVGVGGLVLL